jgi:hypothetical protein
MIPKRAMKRMLAMSANSTAAAPSCDRRRVEELEGFDMR